MDIVADILREWDLAEEAVKRCEQVALAAVIPAVKELRYAGRRIVDALTAAHNGESLDVVRAYLEDARFDCHRARHDAIDAALDVMAKDFDNLTKKLGVDAVMKAYPNFSELYTDFANAREKIAQSRRDRRNRNVIYESISAIDFPNLSNRYANLKTSQPIALQYAAQARRQRFGWWVMFAIMICSLSLAANTYWRSAKLAQSQSVTFTADGKSPKLTP